MSAEDPLAGSSMGAGTWFVVRRRLVGVVFLLVFAVLVWLSIASYNKQFTPVAMVTLHTDTVGSELHQHADVEVRGVVVGEVRTIASDGGGAVLSLAIQPDKVHLIPANVSAEMLPKTLFGERYVDLVLPPDPVAARLGDGGTIQQDRSGSAIELERVFSDLMPMLQAVQPAELSATLSAVSQALSGRGAELGRTLDEIGVYLGRMNPQLPQLDADITQLVTVANAYNTATPDILGALNDLTTTAKTVVSKQNELAALYSTVTSSAGTVTDFLQRNEDTLIRLSADSTGTLGLLAKYSDEFPCTLRALTAFEPAMDTVLGKGTTQPGLHITANVVPSKGKYVYPKDTPVYRDKSGPHCYPVDQPFPGVALDAAKAAAQPVSLGTGGLGPANSPEENELITELASPAAGRPPSALPDWTSVLVGPVYRGAEVTVK
jgi:phospholipid/cholesterol/gamma-HCH transport system substrate-binding protein